MASVIGGINFAALMPGDTVTYTVKDSPDGMYQIPTTTAPTFKVAQVSDLTEHKEKIAKLEEQYSAQVTLTEDLKYKLKRVRALVAEAKDKNTAIVSLAALEKALEEE